MNTKKDNMIKTIMLKLQDIGNDLHSNTDMNISDKADQIDVLLDTMHFLQDYDENVKVLNDYWIKKRQKEKFQGEK